MEISYVEISMLLTVGLFVLICMSTGSQKEVGWLCEINTPLVVVVVVSFLKSMDQTCTLLTRLNAETIAYGSKNGLFV